jgi:hypothetical protein
MGLTKLGVAPQTNISISQLAHRSGGREALIGPAFLFVDNRDPFFVLADGTRNARGTLNTVTARHMASIGDGNA